MHAAQTISMANSRPRMDESSVEPSGSERSSPHTTRFMMLWALVFAAAAAAAATSNVSTPATTPVFDNGVPTNAPVPGNYTGALRPQIHFSPPQNFMNDPNGCHRDTNGTYHLYYQCEFNITWKYKPLTETRQSNGHRGWKPALGPCHFQGPVSLGESTDSHLCN